MVESSALHDQVSSFHPSGEPVWVVILFLDVGEWLLSVDIKWICIHKWGQGADLIADSIGGKITLQWTLQI